MNFISSFRPPENCSDPAWWFIFQNDKILACAGSDSAKIPKVTDPGSLNIKTVSRQYLGILDGIHCYATAIDAQSKVFPEGLSLLSLRTLYGMVPNDLFRIAARASMIMYWDRTHQFCGRCGTPVQFSTVERVKVCPACGFTGYPRISPAVIVAVIRDRRILLGHSKRFPRSFYSVLAGFVEPGETFEECIQREVKEEAGVDVKNIRYFASQAWPFPDSMMVGFTAEYAGGEIKVDGEEVSDAGWFTLENLPEIPGKISIARQLIDWFAENYK
ncbi:MAG: NAD(+) diphosphatase [Spirochaetes bacterium]|nr:MAG: NAD(+) diphosphatase [Spirochaetota bacterium]